MATEICCDGLRLAHSANFMILTFVTQLVTIFPPAFAPPLPGTGPRPSLVTPLNPISFTAQRWTLTALVSSAFGAVSQHRFLNEVASVP